MTLAKLHKRFAFAEELLPIAELEDILTQAQERLDSCEEAFYELEEQEDELTEDQAERYGVLEERKNELQTICEDLECLIDSLNDFDKMTKRLEALVKAQQELWVGNSSV